MEQRRTLLKDTSIHGHERAARLEESSGTSGSFADGESRRRYHMQSPRRESNDGAHDHLVIGFSKAADVIAEAHDVSYLDALRKDGVNEPLTSDEDSEVSEDSVFDARCSEEHLSPAAFLGLPQD